ncbi:hypothetical protein HDV05_006119 [Chytridiales sp. JEL 0842]|nr:hypothetical protein HDV05_006119 [Chytridiales sp. JEL 0842]
MQITLSASDLLATIYKSEPSLLGAFEGRTRVIDQSKTIRTGAGLNAGTVFWVRDLIAREAEGLGLVYDGRQPEKLSSNGAATGPKGSLCVLLAAGTDTLDEFALMLDLILPSAERFGLEAIHVALVGSMKPSDRLGFDGPANVADGLRYLIAQTTTTDRSESSARTNSSVVVVMNSTIHLATEVRKTHSSSLSAFTSHPNGPAGLIDRGQVKLFRHLSANGHERFLKWKGQFSKLVLGDLKRLKVPIMTMGVGMQNDVFNGLPTSQSQTAVSQYRPTGNSLQKSSSKGTKSTAIHDPQPSSPEFDPTFQLSTSFLAQIDALILSLPGSGSLPTPTFSFLSLTHTSRIPIILTTRCGNGGPNYDGFYYRGSLEKFKNEGFWVEEFDGLDAVQSRIVVILMMAYEDRLREQSRGMLSKL